MILIVVGGVVLWLLLVMLFLGLARAAALGDRVAENAVPPARVITLERQPRRRRRLAL